MSAKWERASGASSQSCVQCLLRRVTISGGVHAGSWEMAALWKDSCVRFYVYMCRCRYACTPSRITALSCQRGCCNSVTPGALPCRATQEGRVTVESSDNTRSTGGGQGNPLRCSCLENPTNRMKRQRDLTPEDEPPRSEGVQYDTGKSRGYLLLAPERRKQGARVEATRNCSCVWC